MTPCRWSSSHWPYDVTSLLNVWTPSLDEWTSSQFKWLHLTSETLTWDPTTSHLADHEASLTDYASNIIPRNVSSDAMRGHIGMPMLLILYAP